MRNTSPVGRQARSAPARHARSGETMRALVVGEGGQCELRPAHPIPVPASGEALVRTTCAGVGRVDLEAVRGLGQFRGVIGHRFVGVVEKVEGTLRREMVGRRVVGSVAITCGRCDLCQAGLGLHCRHRALLGLDSRDGCLAEWFTIPVANLHAVPDDLDDDHAVFAEPLASAVQSARQLTIEGKPYITVLGDGAIGLLTVQVMARLNASVRLIGRYSEKLALCEKWAIKHRHVDDVGRRADQDVVVECTGSPRGVELAMQLVRPRGTILLKTIHAALGAVPGVDLSPIALNEISLVGSHRGPILQALAMLVRREVDIPSLISRRMNLDDGTEILRVAADRSTVGVIVRI